MSQHWVEYEATRESLRISPGTYAGVVVVGGDDKRVRLELSGGFNRDELQQAIVVMQQLVSVMK